MTFPIHFEKDLATLAANLLVVVLLNAAQATFIRADKPQHVRRERIVRIESLRLLARIDALEFERVKFCRDLHVEPTRNPNKLLVSVLCFGKPPREVRTILIRNCGNLARRVVGVSYLAGVGEEGFSIETAGQFFSLSIEDLSAGRGGVDRA